MYCGILILDACPARDASSLWWILSARGDGEWWDVYGIESGRLRCIASTAVFSKDKDMRCSIALRTFPTLRAKVYSPLSRLFPLRRCEYVFRPCSVAAPEVCTNHPATQVGSSVSSTISSSSQLRLARYQPHLYDRDREVRTPSTTRPSILSVGGQLWWDRDGPFSLIWESKTMDLLDGSWIRTFILHVCLYCVVR